MPELNLPIHRYYKTLNNVRLKKLDKSKMWFLDGAPIIAITGPPTLYSIPVIQGGPYPGMVLFCSNGIWGGLPTITYEFQWTRNGVDIGGATSALYTLVASDVANTIGCRVTATNSLSSVSALGQPPVLCLFAVSNTGVPSITGTPAVGQTLTIDDGTWDGYPAPAFKYQWRRNGVNVPLETGNQYIVKDADASATITAVVTGFNYHSSATVITAGVNVNIAAPMGGSGIILSGSAEVGNTLTVNTGTWAGSYITYTYQWNVGGVDVPGQVFNYYNIMPADDGKAIYATVFATNPAGSASNVSNTLTVQSAPSNLIKPVLSGSAEVGGTLSVSNGLWSGTPTIVFTYQWKQNGAPIGGETANTLLIDASYAGNTITCEVTATNNAGAASSTTNGAIAFILPTIAGFTISGTPWVGLPLTFSMPVVGGVPASSVSIFWEANGSKIPGAIGTSYILQSAYQGQDINAAVQASNVGGTVIVRSNAITAYWLPFNIIAPVIANMDKGKFTPAVATTFRTTNGSWGGTHPLPKTYQWQRNGVDIPGATNQKYTLQPDDAGSYIRACVTATNAGGSATAYTMSVLVDIPPTNLILPVITGNAFPGSLLSCAPGTWTGVLNTYAYQWRRGNSNIGGATSATYVLTNADVGTNIRCRVTATNVAGSTSANSNIIVPILATPVNTAPPVVSGETIVGSMLSTTDGTWTDATTFTYQWLRNGAPIAGATQNIYASQVADIGQTITSRVMAGPTSAVSSNNVVVTPAVNDVQPVISGNTIVGSLLSTTDGEWTGSGAFTYEWLRDGSPIAGATSSTYTTVEADITATITSRVSIGTTQAVSSNSLVVTSPVNVTPPVVSGNAIVGYTLTTTTGTWQNPVTFTYEWLRDGSPIGGATASTYTTVAADIGTAITSRVTTGGASEVSSNSVAVTAPINLTQPVISGNTSVGSLLTTTNGTWDGLESFTYEWLRDGTPIGGATVDTYTTVAADVGMSITSRVTNLGTAAVSSNSISVPIPVNTVPPVVSGATAIGSILNTTDGTWLNAGPFTYSWLRDAVPIAGEVGSAYTTQAADGGKAIKSRVTTYGVSADSSNEIVMDSSWPFGTDPLWNSVKLMHDFRAGAPFYTYNTPYQPADQKAGILMSSRTIKNDAYGGYYDNPTSGSLFEYAPAGGELDFGSNGAPFTFEWWSAFDYGKPNQSQMFIIHWATAPNQCFYIARLDTTANPAPWSWQAVLSSTGSNTLGTAGGRTPEFYYAGLQHYCFIFNGTHGRTYSNGVFKETFSVTTYKNNATANWYSNMAQRLVATRLTMGTARYGSAPASFTPNANFGKDLP